MSLIYCIPLLYTLCLTRKMALTSQNILIGLNRKILRYTSEKNLRLEYSDHWGLGIYTFISDQTLLCTTLYSKVFSKDVLSQSHITRDDEIPFIFMWNVHLYGECCTYYILEYVLFTPMYKGNSMGKI